MKIAILFDNLGPYHRARLTAAAQVCDLTAVEFGARSREYAWTRPVAPPFSHRCINPWGAGSEISLTEFRQTIYAILDEFRPDAIAIPGWSNRGAFLGMQWALMNQTPAIVMSDSTIWDEPRRSLLEWIKKVYCKGASAGFVAGRPHREYLMQLGVATDDIIIGYDVVDNEYFRSHCDEVRSEAARWRQELQLPQRYFLASARFVPKKNLPRLLQAFAQYRRSTQRENAWNLVLLGDGDQRPQIEELIRNLQIEDYVKLPGFMQYEELPRYYALADAFVHASTTEQWGLVVNEAMARSLPVVVSNRCGCARDLVQEGVNGFTFDPFDAVQLAGLLQKVAALDGEKLASMGEASLALISDWGPARFAKGLRQAAEIAIAKDVKAANWGTWLLLEALARKI